MVQLRFPHPPPKNLKASYRAIWQEFRRCAYLYPPLYHEIFRVFKPGEFGCGDGEATCKAFQQAYMDRLKAPWQKRHATEDGELFGRFTGSPHGLDEFRRLAESAYLVVCSTNDTLPHYGDQGWYMVLHEIASTHPTPLLRSSLSCWGLDHMNGEDIDDVWTELSKWSSADDGQISYPMHPTRYKLKNSVYAASMAAIELILDMDKALLVDDHDNEGPSFNYPISPEEYEVDTEEVTVADQYYYYNDYEQKELNAHAGSGPPCADSICSVIDDAAIIAKLSNGDVEASYGPVSFLFSEAVKKWKIDFRSGEISESEWFNDHRGFQIIALMLKYPHRSQPKPFWELSDELGIAAPLDESTVAMLEATCTSQTSISPEDRKQLKADISNLDARLRTVEGDYEKCENPERRSELEHERNAIRAEHERAKSFLRFTPGVIPAAPKEYLNQKSAVTKARRILLRKMPACGRYLKCVKAAGLGFYFHPPTP